MCTPRSILQLFVEDMLFKRKSVDEEKRKNAEKNLNRYGQTVEQVVHNGWRVIRLPLSSFPSPIFNADGPVPYGNPNYGHINIYGKIADFETFSLIWVDQANVLTEEEILRP